MMIPIILLGGILTGWFTPTEAGVVAVLWIIIVIIPALYRGTSPSSHTISAWRA